MVAKNEKVKEGDRNFVFLGLLYKRQKIDA